MSVRIERLSIRDFGPLRDLVLVPGDVTVVFGQNEAGKTSCIDALARALRERVRPGNRKLLDHLREGPGFSGEIDLLLKPEDGGSVIGLLRDHPTLARLFIIRDADASLEGGRSWMNAIRGRLIGIDLNKVADKVRQAAWLTANGGQREARTDEIRRLKERLARLEGFLADLPSIARLLEEIHQVDRRRATTRTRIEKLRIAERYERYRVAKGAAESMKTTERKLAELARYGDEDLHSWRDAVSAVREAAAVAKAAENETRRMRDEQVLAGEEHRKKELALDRATSRLAEGSRRDLLGTVDRARLARTSSNVLSLWRTPVAIIGTLLLVGAVALGLQATAAAGSERAFTLALFAGGAAMAGLAAGGFSIFATSRMRNARILESQALAACSSILSQTSTIEECVTQVASLATEAERAEAGRQAAFDRKRAIDRGVEEAERAEGECLRRLEEAQRMVADVRARAGLAGLDQLEDKLRQRTEAASTMEEARRTLRTLLGDEDDSMLPRRIESLAVADPGLSPDAAELSRLEREVESFDDRMLKLRAQLGERREQPLGALGLADLGAAEAERERLAQAIETIERETRAGKLCLQALRELGQDIDRPLREALGAESGAAGFYLSQLTGGRYRSVVLDGDGRLAVERGDGTRFGSDVLSRGARDQVALAVRFALVRRLLGEPAFLALDDAFLSSDPTRREALADAFLELAREGWQILYFTFDPALRDRLVSLGAKLIELPQPARVAENAA